MEGYYSFGVLILMVQTCFLMTSVFITFVTIMVNLFASLIPGCIFFQLLKECSPEMRKGTIYKTKSEMRTFPSVLKIYTSLQLNVKMANHYLGSLLLGFQYLVSYIIITCNVTILYLGKKVNWKINILLIAVTLTTTAIWLTILYFSGYSYKFTSNWIRAWRKQTSLYRLGRDRRIDKKYYQKLFKTFRPAGINFSSCFTVTLSRFLKFINFIMWATMKGLLYVKGI